MPNVFETSSSSGSIIVYLAHSFIDDFTILPICLWTNSTILPESPISLYTSLVTQENELNPSLVSSWTTDKDYIFPQNGPSISRPPAKVLLTVETSTW